MEKKLGICFQMRRTIYDRVIFGYITAEIYFKNVKIKIYPRVTFKELVMPLVMRQLFKNDT